MAGLQDHPFFNAVAQGDKRCGEEHGDEHAGDERDGNEPLAPEVPRVAGETVSTAQAFHQGEHEAHGGEERNGAGDDDQMNGSSASGTEVGLDEEHGIRRKNLADGVAQFAEEASAFGCQGEERGDGKQRGKEAENAGIGRGFGVLKSTVTKGVPGGLLEVIAESPE